MAHLHSVYDTDPHFSINIVTRGFKNESTEKVKLMQYDHNSERFTFEIPRHIEEHDMSECNRVEVHYKNGENSGIYLVNDLQVSPNGDDVVICSWLISQNATQYAAPLEFRLTFKCVAENGDLDYVWSTAMYTGISIAPGLYNAEIIVDQYTDVLEQWKNDILSDENICNVPLIESAINGKPTANLRDLASGSYIIDGYFEPYANSGLTLTAEKSLFSVRWSEAGSHIVCLDPLNASVEFYEIIGDEASGFSYNRQNMPLVDVMEMLNSRVEVVNENSTNDEIPTAKAVYDAISVASAIVAKTAAEAKTEAQKASASAENAIANVNGLGVYPGTDCTEKLQEVVAQGGKFYFPSGTYKFNNVTITEDTEFVLDPGAEFHSDSTDFMIKAYGCSFNMRGGKVSSGTNYPNRPNTAYTDDSRKMIGHGMGATILNNTGIIALYGCHNCVIDGVTVPYGSNGSVFTVIGDRSGKNTESEKVTVNGREITIGRSKDIRFINCYFNNFLLSAIHVLYGNDNILVDGCNFTNSLRAKGIDYGYCVCTGVRDVGQDAELYFTPTNGYVIRNCYVENCEGTALDTHGATNVIYEGNKLIDCDNFITAYWDCARVKTAEGWVMENIIVRNNWCRTTKTFNYAGNTYAHNPFMLHSNAPLSKTTGKMRNLIVENNYVESNWYYVGRSQWDMVAIEYVDNIVFRNNVFNTTATSAIVSNMKHCRNVEIDNITLIGTFVQAFEFATSICKLGRFDCTKATFTNAVFANTNYMFSVIDTDSLSVIPAIDNMFSGWRNVLHRYGQILQEAEGIAPLDGTWSTYKGFVGKDLAEGTKRESCTGNVVKLKNGHFLPGTRVYIGTKGYYVEDVESEVVYADDGTKTTYFYFTLDSTPSATNLAESSYLLLHCPYKSKYTATTSE